MDVQLKLSNAFKIFYMKHPNYLGKPSMKELKKDGLLDNIDFDSDDLAENSEIEELYSSEEEIKLF